MKRVIALVGAAIVVAVALPALGQMQMMNPAYGMGGLHGTAVNLVSPANSATQIARGTLMIGATSRGGGSTRYLSLTLRLLRVTNNGALVTSEGNRLLLVGRLVSGSGGETDFAVEPEPEFPVRAGTALLRVAVKLPTLDDQTTLLIDQVAVLDASGSELAVPGIVVASPVAAPPGTTQGAPCTQYSDCDDGDPTTREVCTLFGCQQMPMHGGPWSVPTPGSGPVTGPGTGMPWGSHMGGMM